MKVYKVNVTEGELRLFSEFLEQREFGGDFFEDSVKEANIDVDKVLNKGPLVKYSNLRTSKVSKDYLKNLSSEDTLLRDFLFKESSNHVEDSMHKSIKRGISKNKNLSLGDKLILSQNLDHEWCADDSSHTPSNMPEELKDNKHRMSIKVINHLDKLGKDYHKRIKQDSELPSTDEELRRFQEDSDKFEESLKNLDKNYDTEELSKEMIKARNIIDKEELLKNSKYDDKYSSKRFEKFLDKKIDADKAKNIVDRRHAADTDYLAKDAEKGRDRNKFHISDIGRKWNDAGIVYNEALDRNLNKDAAIAAGATAALVGGGIALRKHLKKKKQEKELAEKKYKTSDKKKK